MDYKHKYLKYKQKYINLQTQITNKSNNTIKDAIGGGTRVNTLNLFKADWCGHCIAFKDTWGKLQNNKEFNIKYKTYDADAHKTDIANWKIQGFPTLILQTGNKSVEFVGEKTIDSISKFIKEYS
jgi:thiol-disulfide isomerase/thioredoxin